MIKNSQRLSIARAILKNAPILLLDEATARLDVDNELVGKRAVTFQTDDIILFQIIKFQKHLVIVVTPVHNKSGFAQGGRIYIGKDDTGKITGIMAGKKLLEDIPNKIRDILGIIVDVNLYTEFRKDYLEIVVNPNPYPVNYYGEYHYRTGSTKQLLKGQALNQFLMQKQE